MAKVMIVDDGLVGQVRNREKKEQFHIGYETDEIYTLRNYINKELKENIGPYNLSEVSKGKHELYLSRFPIVPVHNPNFFYDIRNAKTKKHKSNLIDIARKNFDLEKIIEEIKSVNPDFLFVDLGLPCFAEESFVDDFLVHAKKASSKYDGWPPINKFYDVVGRDSIPYQEKIRYNEGFNSYLKNLGPALVKKLTSPAGGVAVGNALMKENIPFSFWTADFGHAGSSLIAAEMCGLVSENDISSAIECYSGSFHTGEKRIFPISNKKGNILFEGKGYLLEDNSILVRAVEAVRDYQQNWNL